MDETTTAASRKSLDRTLDSVLGYVRFATTRLEAVQAQAANGADIDTAYHDALCYTGVLLLELARCNAELLLPGIGDGFSLDANN